MLFTQIGNIINNIYEWRHNQNNLVFIHLSSTYTYRIILLLVAYSSLIHIIYYELIYDNVYIHALSYYTQVSNNTNQAIIMPCGYFFELRDHVDNNGGQLRVLLRLVLSSSWRSDGCLIMIQFNRIFHYIYRLTTSLKNKQLIMATSKL